MIEKDHCMMKMVKKAFNHYFVIDVKLANYRDNNCSKDPSTINYLIEKEDLINKM